MPEPMDDSSGGRVGKDSDSATLITGPDTKKGVLRRAAALTFDFHFWSSHPSSAVRLFDLEIENVLPALYDAPDARRGEQKF